ncbi:MAG: hypothetical protein WA947_08200 [Phormidesmis sp.]|mgnify:CR=1 FL=1
MQQLTLFEEKDIISEALRRSLSSFADAEKRWQHRVQSGLSDAALAEAIAYEFGSCGGGFQEGMYYKISGGSGNPAFTYYLEGSLRKKKQIMGKKLLDRVRKLKSVPFP